MKKITVAVLFVAVVGAGSFAQVQMPARLGVVTLDSGRVSGTAAGQGNTVSVFKGLPYVAPPVSDLRWRDPQPVTAWTNVRPATEFGPVQPQRASPQEQNEDSLTMNVWSPAKTASERLPVLVWIHGGSFTFGASAVRIYDGSRLAEHGVVVASFNYRLNVLAGFAHPLLSKESGHGSGNYGLLDQIAALRWVQRNITAFGGDSGNVTIVGESAGGLSITALLVSPMTTGLFHKAIIESGTNGFLTTQDAAEQAGVKLVKQMGLDSAPNLLAALRTKRWKDFPDAANYSGAPVLDDYVFTENPFPARQQGHQHNVPIIVGYNLDEATSSIDRDGPMPANVAQYEKSVRARFGARADRMLALYPAKTSAEAYWAEIAIRTDRQMAFPTRATLRGWFSVSSKAWEYHFSYLPDADRESKLGVSHGAELPYVFGTVPPGSDQKTRDMSNAVMNYWTQFAKTGNPNQSGLPAWPAFEKGNEGYLELGRSIQAGKDLDREKLDIFQAIQQAR